MKYHDSKKNIILSPLYLLIMRKILHAVILGVLVLFAFSCQKEDIYKRPKWLAGKLFAQIQKEADLSTFARCIELAGYDTLINRSGSYTVFAPSNSAFDLYFQAHPQYATVEDIPLPELIRIVKFHIVQDPWSLNQLHQLDVYGWIDSLDLNNNEPRGFKRETLLRDKDTKYGVKNSLDVQRIGDPKKYIIVDTLQTTWFRRLSTDSRKYAPFFYKQYMDIYKLNSDDYAFYFSRPFEAAKTYFVNAQITKADIFAENGFIHIVDRVVEPLKSGYQILDDKTGQYSYSSFLNLINTFPEFDYSDEKTKAQPGANLGYVVDSLFDITYPQLAFDILNERTKAPHGVTGLPNNVTVRYQNGLVAPTNEAMAQFESDFFTGPGKWGSLQQAPVHVRRMIVNTHMANGPLYPSNFSRGYYNGENDWISLDQSAIIQKEYGSNCTFVGVNKVMTPRAFSSITGPIYLEQGYSRIMYAIERSGLLAALKRKDNDYVFYVENDANLALDSSLLYNPITERFQIFQVTEFTAQAMSTTTSDLRNLILNHLGLRHPTGVPRKEFIKTLGSNYLVVNNVTGEVRGSAPTTFGYRGLMTVQVIPQPISTNADNGTTYDISNWFNFSTGTIYSKISASYPAFHNLLVSAGLADTRLYKYNFLSDDENYTVFVPSAAAIAAYSTSGMTTDQLRKFLMMHFVQGSLIFTDGYQQPGYYETTRIDEKSTQYTKIYTKVYINPVTDAIEFRYKNGTNYLTVNESAATNFMTAKVIDPAGTTLTIPTIVTNGVIHEIDKVFVFTDMDTE